MNTSPGERELALVLVGFAALTIALTSPLAFHLGTILYKFDTNLDGQFSIWNVAWVARTLVVDPLHVFDANIFYPHRWTLAYSETNLGAGALAMPVYWATGSPYAAHNFVLLLSFVLSATGTYYLVRYLVNDRRAAVVAAICFAYCPYVFAHLPHIQLLMTAGLPFSLLAFHRLADRPSAGRGAVLGAIMAAQAFFCAYYAVFVMVMVGYAVVFVAASRRLWRVSRYWIAVAVASLTAIVPVLPILAVYVMLRRATGFSRSVDAAGSFSADWRAYFASSAYAHAWILGLLHTWRDVLFPGFVALAFGIGGVVAGWFRGRRGRELAALYGSLGGAGVLGIVWTLGGLVSSDVRGVSRVQLHARTWPVWPGGLPRPGGAGGSGDRAPSDASVEAGMGRIASRPGGGGRAGSAAAARARAAAGTRLSAARDDAVRACPRDAGLLTEVCLRAGEVHAELDDPLDAARRCLQ